MDQAFVAEDVRTAVFQMAPTKSPGADGMSAIFYQKFWPIIGEDITAACLSFVNGGLCNVIYKIISKMLANRLRRVMGSVISEEQSAFIPGRLITDNAIIGFESLHAIKRRKTKKNYLALKLDMAKVYDRVEWEFIQRMMTKLGFSGVWINKIMACISSVTYSFQFNGKRFGHLTPSRGLRQGDPLSPYLFLLCGEGLSSLLHRYEQNEVLQGLRCGTRGPTISHLLFADDSLFFLEAKLSACAAVKEILRFYEAASGQVVNLSKSAVCFGPNTPESDAAQMVALLGVPKVSCHEKYLGLPCFSGKNKQGLFSSIRDRVWNKLCGWKSKLLLAGGREVLSKAIIQAIPTYAMNLFKLPSSLIKELHRLSAQFWWGGEHGKRKIILWGRELYKQGLRRKIGSGQDTYIYHDCWLPRAGVFKISSPRVLGKFDKVSSLITASGSWDSSLIRESFHEDEAEAILSLPLPKRTTPDTLRWHYDKSGHYTVRSGYWLANNCRSVPSSSTSSLNSWWKRFWRLRVPSKIRIFIWKAFYNWIPSSVNLANHGVPTQKRCLICNEADDTTLHALWGCKALDSLKVLCDSFIHFKLPPQCDLKEFLLSANDDLSVENLEFLCILLWRIWFRRNKWVHERTWLDDDSCYSWARLHHADFLEANCRKGDPSKKKFGLGSVIRDHTGKVLGSVAIPVASSVSVAVAESWALEKGASLAKQMGFSAVILESDCLGVTKALESRTLIDSDLSYVFDSIYEICNEFDMYKFSYTPRIGNQVAHSLARLALSLENDQYWPSGIPESLIPLVSADSQHVPSS
ncbi:hypothetical protein UlMin_039111 [Ulmus minor]